MRTLACIVVAAAMLCGCSSGPAWKSEAFAFAAPTDAAPVASTTNIIALTGVSVSPLFQGRPFTYRIGEDAYEQDPYAGFLVAPDRAIAESIRASLRPLGEVLEPGSALAPSLCAEVTVQELYGDLRDPAKPLAVMEIRFLIYEKSKGGPGRVVMDTTVERSAPMGRKSPDALIAAWDVDLREIMGQVVSEYAKANPNDSGR